MKSKLIIVLGLFLSLFLLIVYLVTRLSLFLIADYSYIEKLFAVLLIVSELFILLHALGYILNIFAVIKHRENENFYHKKLKEQPPVAVLVAARHEPKDVLEKTVVTLLNLKYQNKTVYLLDDSSDEYFKRQVDELGQQYNNLKVFRRSNRHGAKAGIINDCLKNLEDKYIAIFDADQNPLQGFLDDIIPIMEGNEKLAFIQTPQFYSNREESRVSRAAGFQQDVFYEYICEGKSLRGAMFCCGTNLVIRRDALVGVGGFNERSVTEDFATSLALHASGWQSRYYNHVYAFGMGPADLAAYFRQQFRWATGTLTVLKMLVRLFLTRPFSLKPQQWWEYFLSSTYYFIGTAFFFLMICPIVYLLFKIPSFFVMPELYFLTFLPYFIFSLVIFYSLLGRRNYKFKDLFLGQLLGLCAFPVYIFGAFSALLGLSTSFTITPKAKQAKVSYFKLWPQLVMILLNCISVIWGINRFVYEKEPAIIINCFWSLYYFCCLSSIFYFNTNSQR